MSFDEQNRQGVARPREPRRHRIPSHSTHPIRAHPPIRAGPGRPDPLPHVVPARFG